MHDKPLLGAKFQCKLQNIIVGNHLHHTLIGRTSAALGRAITFLVEIDFDDTEVVGDKDATFASATRLPGWLTARSRCVRGAPSDLDNKNA